MRYPTPEAMAKYNVNGVVLGVNWRTGEIQQQFLSGDDVPARCAAVVRAHSNSAGWQDWTFTYLLRDEPTPLEVLKEAVKGVEPNL